MLVAWSFSWGHLQVFHRFFKRRMKYDWWFYLWSFLFAAIKAFPTWTNLRSSLHFQQMNESIFSVHSNFVPFLVAVLCAKMILFKFTIWNVFFVRFCQILIALNGKQRNFTFFDFEWNSIFFSHFFCCLFVAFVTL